MADAENAETPATSEPATEPPATGELGPEGEKALQAFKERAKVAEREAKATKAELEKLRELSMSETEKAVKAARDEGFAVGRKEGSSLIAQAEIRAAAAGRPVDVDALLEGVDATRFIDDAGDVDRAAITGWLNKVAPIPEPETNALFPDLGQGNRGENGTSDPAQDFAKFLTKARQR